MSKAGCLNTAVIAVALVAAVLATILDNRSEVRTAAQGNTSTPTVTPTSQVFPPPLREEHARNQPRKTR